MADDIEAAILAMMRRDLHLAVDAADADLLSSGLLDSLALVDLLARLEQAWSITIPLDQLDLEDVRSVRRIAALVARQRGPG